MICKIGLFSFDAHSVTGMNETLSAKFAKHDRVENFPTYEPVGESEESISLQGYNVKASVDEMRWMKLQIKMKIPVRFTTLTQSFLVIIEELHTSRDTFVHGAHLYERFEISMKRYYPDLSILGQFSKIGAFI